MISESGVGLVKNPFAGFLFGAGFHVEPEPGESHLSQTWLGPVFPLGRNRVNFIWAGPGGSGNEGFALHALHVFHPVLASTDMTSSGLSSGSSWLGCYGTALGAMGVFVSDGNEKPDQEPETAGDD